MFIKKNFFYRPENYDICYKNIVQNTNKRQIRYLAFAKKIYSKSKYYIKNIRIKRKRKPQIF